MLLQGLLYTPASSSKEAVIFVHGATGNFYQDRFIDSMAKKFTEKGYTFLAANNRGHDFISMIPVVGTAEYKKIGAAFETFTDCILDIKAMIDFLEKEGYTKFVLIGHSLGASKVAFYQSQKVDKRVKKIIFISPIPVVDIYNTDPSHHALEKQATELIGQGRTEEIMDNKLLGWVYICPTTYLQYGVVSGAADIFNTKKITQNSPLSKITVPIVVVWGDKDELCNLISIPQCISVVKQEAINTTVNVEIIQGAGHTYEGFEKILSEKINNFLDCHLKISVF